MVPVCFDLENSIINGFDGRDVPAYNQAYAICLELRALV